MNTVCIYGLHAPGDDTIMYVGQTRLPTNRLTRHINDAPTGTPTPVRRWVRSLLDGGNRPCMVILEKVEDRADTKERAWIEKVRSANPNLTNCPGWPDTSKIKVDRRGKP